MTLATLLGTSGTAFAKEVRVVGLFAHKAVVMIDGRQVLLRKDAAATNGVRLLSADSETAVIEVDGDARELRMSSASVYRSAPPRADNSTRVPIWPDSRGMYRTVGSINGFTVDFLVDTGATLVVMNNREARRLGLDYIADGDEGLAHTASGTVKTWLIRLKKVKVGNIELHDVDGSVIEGAHPTQVLLGMSFLGKLDINRDGTKMVLKTK